MKSTLLAGISAMAIESYDNGLKDGLLSLRELIVEVSSKRETATTWDRVLSLIDSCLITADHISKTDTVSSTSQLTARGAIQ